MHTSVHARARSDGIEFGAYAERGLFVARCACTHASGCVLPAWRPERVSALPPRRASEHGSHVVRCACTHVRRCLMSLWRHAYASRSSCAPSIFRGDAAKHSLRVARCARAGAEYLCAAPSPPRHGLHVTRCAGAHASSCGLADTRQSSCQSATCAHTRVQLYAASSPPR